MRSQRPQGEVYRNLRAAAESGWDFSSRWLADGKTLASIRTVDLSRRSNSLLYQLGADAARAHEAASAARAEEFRARAEARKAAIHRYLWNARIRCVHRLSCGATALLPLRLTAATLAPLFFGLASQEQADAVAHNRTRAAVGSSWFASRLPMPPASNGMRPTAGRRCNGWRSRASSATARRTGRGHREALGKAESRRVRDDRQARGEIRRYLSGRSAAGGGEYPLQDGFGWTNGVLRALLARYPEMAVR